MFRSLKAPVIASIVGVAFICYIFGPGRFRTEKVAAKPPGAISDRLASAVFGISQPQKRFDGPNGAASQSNRVTEKPPPETTDERYSHLLDDLQEMVRRAQMKRAARQSAFAELQAIRADRKQLAALQPEVESSFQAAALYLHDRQLPSVLLERSVSAEREFAARGAQLSQLLASLGSEDDRRQLSASDAAVEKLAAFFGESRQGAPVQRVDFKADKLPFRPAVAVVRPPASAPGQFPAALVAAAPRPALSSTQAIDPNLAPTEDVQITQPIKDLAASLGNDPVRIYGWVRNNIEWLPTYGSLQGSAVTLSTKRGNAFDTSSLLIALYRAANIPARYVYGTIEVPAGRVSNWLGGIKPLAAQQLMGQGGIPSLAITAGGSILSVRLEHVWVEAFVDFVPSRGAINKVPDTWAQLDPSFKQYQLTAPIDLQAAIPVDIDGTAAAVARTALVDNVHRSITGFDQGALDAWAEKMSEDVGFKYGGSPDIKNFIGGKTIIAESSSVLAGSIPNKVVTRAGAWSELPSSLRHKVTMALYGSPLDRALGGPQMTYEVSLPALAGRRLGVTWLPSSAADAAALASFRSTPDGDMPVYLVQVQPSIRIDDVEVARGPSVTMGSAEGFDTGLVGPNDPSPEIHTYNVTAGDEMVWGIDAQGISQEMIHQRFLQRPSDTAAENLFTVALYYWGQYDALAQSAATARNAAVQRLPSIGLFSAPLRVNYFFGLPRSGHYSAREMDVAHSIFAIIDKDNGDRSNFQRIVGLIGSLLEGRTFDSLFGRAIGTGVSAVQLLREANEQKIPIFLITAANYAAISAKLQVGAEIQAEISNAVAAGKTVLIPQRAPVHGNWSGIGYIVEDPATGSAAYLINGGLNGGAQDPCPPEKKKEPVRFPIVEIIIILLIIAFIVVFWESLLVLGPAIVKILVGLGELAPAASALLLALGLAATPSSAGAAPLPGPPLPGDGLKPPGDCTPQQYAALVAAKVGTCDVGPSCKTTDCATATAALARLQACVAARLAVMVQCFRGGDQIHKDQLDDTEKAVVNCACTVARVCP